MNNLKKFVIFIMCLSLTHVAFSKDVDRSLARKVAENKIAICQKDNVCSIKSMTEIKKDDVMLFYLVELLPQGFIMVSADDCLNPVLAYSFDTNADPNAPLLEIIKSDIQLRLDAVDKLPESKINERKAAWNELLQTELNKDYRYQQWPEQGTTSTGGWVEARWSQTSPWNAMCPIDPVTHNRSYTGCPATAMAMILDYHKTTNNTHFSDEDDYYHSYAGRNFQIDDDYAEIGFPSFPDLNNYLDTVCMHWYKGDGELTNQDKAALSFACGIAARQVYTSQASGTFGVNQALDAYKKFGCTNAELLTDNDENLFPTMIANIQQGMPVHYAMVDPSNTTGHNVIVDGYNSDNYYHVNFGYAGTYDGWYILPDDMPMGLTVVEGVVVNIMQESLNVTEQNQEVCSVNVYPNPAKDVLYIECKDNEPKSFRLIDYTGRLVAEKKSFAKNTRMDIGNLLNGLYMLQVMENNVVIKNHKVLISK